MPVLILPMFWVKGQAFKKKELQEGVGKGYCVKGAVATDRISREKLFSVLFCCFLEKTNSALLFSQTTRFQT
ncbi:hypothetical protein C943_03979 [Mariniradius saccharolyticus AK6]|uniref:Uncharacterized protein n=1 Tax=Mariniradius saccharolyticus AK6 TaxID=1239962 RepID=M7Y079_9BACT|nr:hypothetical protein C943_03979 [Mariniradius saccharolyticus AK6]